VIPNEYGLTSREAENHSREASIGEDLYPREIERHLAAFVTQKIRIMYKENSYFRYV
jgi:hypothetical protein